MNQAHSGTIRAQLDNIIKVSSRKVFDFFNCFLFVLDRLHKSFSEMLTVPQSLSHRPVFEQDDAEKKNNRNRYDQCDHIIFSSLCPIPMPVNVTASGSMMS